MNLVAELKRFRAEGLNIDAVYLEPAPDGEYYAEISFSNYVPHGEGGDLPRHRVTVDLENLPEGIKVGGWERVQNERISLGKMSEGEAHKLIKLVQVEGAARDIARFDRPGDARGAWLTKPNRWRNPT